MKPLVMRRVYFSIRLRLNLAVLLVFCCFALVVSLPSFLGQDQGTLLFDTPDFTLKLVKASQTLASLQPKQAGGFDFAPADRLDSRAADGFNAVGDLTLSVRQRSSGPWENLSTGAARRPLEPLPAGGSVLAAADLTSTLPANCPIRITRQWLLENGKLVLRFELKNISPNSVQIGALGMPMVFNNMLRGRPLTEMAEVNSFSDPAINEDGGYLQVTRLNGHGPTLVVVPDGKTIDPVLELLQSKGVSLRHLVEKKQSLEDVFVALVDAADPDTDPRLVSLLQELDRLEIPGEVDNVWFDAKRKRVYASCGEGFIAVIQQKDADHYVRIARQRTAPGARTGLFVPEWEELFVAVPHRGEQRAEILVYGTK